MSELCEMRVMDPWAGDLKSVWDPDNEDEVAMAKEQFEKLQKKSFIIYKVDKKGDKSEIMKKFDPEAKCMIAAPFVAGG